MKCRKCGKGANEIGGFLKRVNEKGVPGIWECRPACAVEMTLEDRLLCALEHDEGYEDAYLSAREPIEKGESQ